MRRVQRGRRRCYYQAAGDYGEVRENPRMNAAEHGNRNFKEVTNYKQSSIN